ncbi:SsgA family sporulation/cell division regulator [Streptomyces sp. NPDC051286]|uniref:SsgA family sporulation/cell division regulator n=1 Tax=Streptomyces sp. NPDC051286 TaxID=3365647 RepID=UPI00379E823B
MSGEQSGLRVGQTAPEEMPPLCLVVRHVVDGFSCHPVHAEFRFGSDTPMVVSLTFSPWFGPSVTWRIGRELLLRGLYEKAGEGDVRVWPTQGGEGDTARLLLKSGGARAVFELPISVVGVWLTATYQIVPAMAETGALDWDAFLSDLLDPEIPTD